MDSPPPRSTACRRSGCASACCASRPAPRRSSWSRRSSPWTTRASSACRSTATRRRRAHRAALRRRVRRGGTCRAAAHRSRRRVQRARGRARRHRAARRRAHRPRGARRRGSCARRRARRARHPAGHLPVVERHTGHRRLRGRPSDRGAAPGRRGGEREHRRPGVPRTPTCSPSTSCASTRSVGTRRRCAAVAATSLAACFTRCTQRRDPMSFLPLGHAADARRAATPAPGGQRHRAGRPDHPQRMRPRRAHRRGAARATWSSPARTSPRSPRSDGSTRRR